MFVVELACSKIEQLFIHETTLSSYNYSYGILYHVLLIYSVCFIRLFNGVEFQSP